jgi:chromate transporter
MSDAAIPAAGPREGTPLEVFVAFLKLGLSAFGGPIAHLGYFREEFVTRRRWLDEAAFADIVALCQFLPGPVSSQVGFGLGLMRAGPLGALAAWSGFTLPSAILMAGAAYGATAMSGPLAEGLVHGLKLVAVAVIAQAVLGMARTLTPDARRAGIAVGAIAIVTLASATIGQIAAIVFGLLAGLTLCQTAAQTVPAHIFKIPRSAGLTALAFYIGLLVGGPIVAVASKAQSVAWFDAFYRSGALVFGGGHVVLPLLKQAVVAPGWVDQETFLAGYGAAQAIPGPLFTFGVYLGAIMDGLPGAVLGLLAIFLPGILALLAALPFWTELRSRPAAQAAMRGANASVVGILAAALYNTVWTSAVLGPVDFAVAVAGFVLLVAFRSPPLIVVALGVVFGMTHALLG